MGSEGHMGIHQVKGSRGRCCGQKGLSGILAEGRACGVCRTAAPPCGRRERCDRQRAEREGW